MQEKEYAQIYELGLGSLIGDFFQNVKDTVTGVARAVAPIAPYVLPFVLPGIGGAIGGKLGSFLGSRLGQYAIGAGIQGLAGQKPADIAKNLALQVASSGIAGITKGGEGTIGQRFMSGVTGREIPQVTNIPVNEKFAEAINRDIAVGNMTPNTVTDAFSGANATPEKGFFGKMGDKFMASFDPRQRAINPQFQKMKLLGDVTGNPISDEMITAMGIPKEASFTYQYGPAAYGILSAAPLAEQLYNQYINPPEEEEDTGGYENLYAMDPSQYQIGSITGYNPQGYFMAAEGGEVTGFAEGGGQKIQHPDGDTKEHPKRIGEIVGRGTGTSDDIPAMLSDGEFVMTAKAVRNAGGGSRKVGAKNMYKMMKSLENGGSLSQQSIGMA
jgi:hypothetical protein